VSQFRVWRDAVAQVSANRRLAVMLAGVGIVLLVLGIDFVLTHLDEQQSELRTLHDRRDRLEALSGSEEWVDRARAATTSLEALEAGIPPARSAGLAQALFQGWLRERTAGMDGSVFTQVTTPQDVGTVEAISDLVRVTGTVTGSSHRDTVIDLIRRAEASSNLIVVDAFALPSDSNTGFSITLSAYYRIDASSGVSE